jgi:hypothetical protein
MRAAVPRRGLLRDPRLPVILSSAVMATVAVGSIRLGAAAWFVVSLSVLTVGALASLAALPRTARLILQIVAVGTLALGVLTGFSVGVPLVAAGVALGFVSSRKD